MGQGPSNLTKIPINAPGSHIMNPSDFGFTTDTIKVEHAFTFSFGDKWDRPLRKFSESLAKVGLHFSESFRIIATGLSAYFVLAGLAKLVAATRSTDDSSNDSKTRSSRRTGTSRSKDKTAIEKISSEEQAPLPPSL